jgi:hypothetical protein
VTAEDRTLKRAAGLIGAGLAVEVVTSLVVHPLAFVAFLGIACPLVAAGMGLFLWQFITRSDV